MTRLLLIVAAWSLVAVPGLCRVGAFDACCTHDARPAPVTTCCDHSKHGPADESPRPSPAERECGSCATVCGGVVKPDDAGGLSELTQHMPMVNQLALLACWNGACAGAEACHRDRIDGAGVSMRRSDMPLRI